MINFPLIPIIQRKFKRLKRNTIFSFLKLSKRQVFLITTIIMTLGLLLAQTVVIDYRYPFVLGLSVCSFFLSAFALREDLSGIEWLTLLILPTLFTASVGFFYFLLPVRWLTRIPVLILYGISYYALLLTENIYNIAAMRTIALLRAAHTVGFLLLLVTIFFLTNTVFSLSLNPFLTSLFVAFYVYPLIISLLWTMELTPVIGDSVQYIASIVTLLVVESTWILAFLPIDKSLLSLFITALVYVTSGVAEQFLQEKLYKKTLVEFIIVLSVVALLVVFSFQWRSIP
jgi:hypothetical protein